MRSRGGRARRGQQSRGMPALHWPVLAGMCGADGGCGADKLGLSASGCPCPPPRRPPTCGQGVAQAVGAEVDRGGADEAHAVVLCTLRDLVEVDLPVRKVLVLQHKEGRAGHGRAGAAAEEVRESEMVKWRRGGREGSCRQPASQPRKQHPTVRLQCGAAAMTRAAALMPANAALPRRHPHTDRQKKQRRTCCRLRMVVTPSAARWSTSSALRGWLPTIMSG